MSTIQMQITLKKAFAPVSFFSSHLVQDLMSKHPEHLKSKIRYRNILTSNTENPFYPLHSSWCSGCRVLKQMARALNSIQLKPNTAGMQPMLVAAVHIVRDTVLSSSTVKQIPEQKFHISNP